MKIFAGIQIVFCYNFLGVFAIDCFKCVSINNTYQPCEDPFHNNYTTDIFHSPCMTGEKG
ncbi:hypothetical protein NQ317_005284 [Molorchus minor]|uniref:Uncharacterized protein n=1 Tax=Molorchus minor TaxID=1323400 RepID=A0ABQ9JYB8_9CUCU|nr:hypothetical protein NQ317_005284 [Molorchus minor]